MSKYTRNNAIGDAGEYFFAYKVTRKLGWPCRLLDIDIGIDAQIELIGKDAHSTGKFIAVQIKTTTTDKTAIEVEESHLEYWRKVESRVLIALVNLSQKKIYTKFIHEIPSLDVANDQKRRRTINFRNSEIFTESSGKKWRNEVFAKEMSEINNLLMEVNQWTEQIIDDCDSDHPQIIDLDLPVSTLDEFKQFETKLYRAKLFVEQAHNLIGRSEYEKSLSRYDLARDSFIAFARKNSLFLNQLELLRYFETDYYSRYKYLGIEPL